MSEEYTLEDLKPIAANEYRQEPTGTYHTNRDGRRIPDTKGTEYVVTKVGKMPESEWYEHLRKAVKREGKEELLEQIKAGTPAFKAADADHDNVLTPADARLILRASVGLEKL